MTDHADLQTVFGPLADSLPTDQERGFITLDEANLPVPPATLATARLCITFGHHFYNDTPVDALTFEIDRPTSAQLGLLILASIFHREPSRTALHLTHPRSSITRVLMDYDWDDKDGIGYLSRPLRFNYYPAPKSRHPWNHTGLTPTDLPVITLTNEDEMITGSEQLSTRNTAVGFGHAQAAALFAELLLDASLPSSETLEYELEGELGFRGVGVGSAEITIWLPGGLGYLDTAVVGRGW